MRGSEEVAPVEGQRGFGELLPTSEDVAPLKGIGFTVAIFISVLAFEDASLQNQAKLAILTASAIAATFGLGLLYARQRLLG